MAGRGNAKLALIGRLWRFVRLALRQLVLTEEDRRLWHENRSLRVDLQLANEELERLREERRVERVARTHRWLKFQR